MNVLRTEKHLIKCTNLYYSLFCDYAHRSNNLFNYANYIIRNEFINNGRQIRYNELDVLLKNNKEYDNYKKMPTARSAQQILRLIDKDWKSFFTAIKDWSIHKDKYLGKPKLPKYKSKGGKFSLILTNQDVKFKNGILVFPKVFNGFILKPRFVRLKNFQSFQQVRIIPKYNYFIIELIYNISIPDTAMNDNGKYLSIDIGVDNLATITNNIGIKPIAINGKGLKSINQYYNKEMAHYRSIAKKMNDTDFTNRMATLTRRRNFKIDDYLHKASYYIIKYALSLGANTIVIGNNKGWKQKSKMNRIVNQSFVGIPHMRFIEMIQYKAQNVGLNVILQEESYTSGTSFLDKEEPVKANYNKSRRIKRGLFVSNKGIKINADINGSYQILMKVFPNAFAEGIEGVVLHPVKVNIV